MAPRRSVPSAGGGGGLARRLRRWLARELRRLRPVIEASAAACRAEHGRKHFTSYQHVCLLLFHGLTARRSLRQSYEQFAACRGLVAASGLAAPDGSDRLGVSYSQVAASNGARPAARIAGHPRLDLPAPEPPPGRLVARARAPGRLGGAGPALAAPEPGPARGARADLGQDQRPRVLEPDRAGRPGPSGDAG